MARKMQFIDLKEALADLKKEVWWSDSEKVHIRRFLKNQKVIEIEPVVRGEWVLTEEIPGLEKSVECSACHCKTYYPKSRWCDMRLTRYCPDCGARMNTEET